MIRRKTIREEEESMADSSEMKELLRWCPICSSNVGEVLHHQRFALPGSIDLPEAYDVVACPTCGLVFADTPVGQQAYDRYYERLSKYEDPGSTGGGSTDYDLARLQRAARDISKVLKLRQAAILDVGCANGGLLLAFRELGYQNLTGLDPSKGCVSHVSSRGIAAVHGGIFSSIRFDQQFDCIVLSHVLEHLYDLQRAIRNVLSWLKDGGVVYAEVPDASRYLQYPQVPFYYFDIEHINHLDAHSLRNLFSQWEVDSVAEEEKAITVSRSRLLYPAVYSICRKIGHGIRRSKPVYSRKVRDVAVEFAKKSAMEREQPELAELARTQEEVVVWGAGNFSYRLLSSGSLAACNIRNFVDRDSKKHGQLIRGIEVREPANLVGFQGPIVVAAALHCGEIAQEIRSMGLANRLILIR